MLNTFQCCSKLEPVARNSFSYTFATPPSERGGVQFRTYLANRRQVQTFTRMRTTRTASLVYRTVASRDPRPTRMLYVCINEESECFLTLQAPLVGDLGSKISGRAPEGRCRDSVCLVRWKAGRHVNPANEAPGSMPMPRGHSVSPSTGH